MQIFSPCKIISFLKCQSSQYQRKGMIVANSLIIISFTQYQEECNVSNSINSLQNGFEYRTINMGEYFLQQWLQDIALISRLNRGRNAFDISVLI